MSKHSARLAVLKQQIAGGRAVQALPELDRLLRRQPRNATLLTLRADALNLAGRRLEAIDAYRHAGELGADPQVWRASGLLLAGGKSYDQALQHLRKALDASPDEPAVLDALIKTLILCGRAREGIEYARRQIATSSDPRLLLHAGGLLQAVNDTNSSLHGESALAFRKALEAAPDDGAILGAALVSAMYTCDWEWASHLKRKILEHYRRGEFDAVNESSLWHLSWCDDEAINLGVTRAEALRTARLHPPVTPLQADPPPPGGRRIRVGYLSSDFNNHATLHLMAGLFERHDRERFEVFAYDYSLSDDSEQRRRFLAAVEHHVPVHEMTDAQAASRIAADGIDILFDLKLYTTNTRPGIAQHRPAPVIAAYIGFPGSAALPHVDYVISDRIVTPDGSAPCYSEKFCRLPNSYQSNDRLRPAAPVPGTREDHGLPTGPVVFGSFNQTYKIDPGSFDVWMRILRGVPDSVLWLLCQDQTARTNLLRHAQDAGIGPDRIVFAPAVAPRLHLARLRLVDAVLDTLVYNGHTTTSDMLWAGVPVITARGRHFASRVGESLLNAAGVPELVGTDAEDMVRIGVRVGTDATYRAGLRRRLEDNRLVAPLFDTARFTRDFETGIEMMVGRSRRGLPPEHIDVPDAGVVTTQPATAPSHLVPGLQEQYAFCPLCGNASAALRQADCSAHPQWHPPLPPVLDWMRCTVCGHLHTRGHWTAAGTAEIFRNAPGFSIPAPPATQARNTARAELIRRVAVLLASHRTVVQPAEGPVWFMVGCTDDPLMAATADHGFATLGLESSPWRAARLKAMGCRVLHAGTGAAQAFLDLDFGHNRPDVICMAGSLQQAPIPIQALRKAAEALKPHGVLAITTLDRESPDWQSAQAAGSNPAWADLERHHVFSRTALVTMLKATGLDVVDVRPSPDSSSDIEILAVRPGEAEKPQSTHPGKARSPADRPYHVLHLRPPGYIHAEALTEMAETIYHGLKRLGVPATYTEQPLPDARSIVFGAHLCNEQAAARLPADAIIFNSEQVYTGSPWLSGPYMDILRNHEVWDYSAENVTRLSGHGVNRIRHVPLGYVPELTRIRPAPEDIDVLFYGSINPRRQQILDTLKARGLNVVGLFGCYGRERDDHIARAKVVLNLHFYDGKIFETARVSYLLANGKAIVAETGPETSVPAELKDCILGVPYEGLVDACVNLVRDASDRNELARRGSELFMRMPMEPVLAHALRLDLPRQPSSTTSGSSAPTSAHGKSTMVSASTKITDTRPASQDNRSTIYQWTVSPDAPNDPRSMMLRHISPGSSVLDVGCACGDLGVALHRYRNCEVYGLEYDSGSVLVAQRTGAYKCVSQTDLNTFADDAYPGYVGKFDWIAFGDVLEHVYDPQAVLRKMLQYLKPEGRFLISLPNLAHASIKAALLLDDFTYTDVGLLDKTHIRFFTHRTLPDFLAKNHLVVEDFECTAANMHGFQPTDPFPRLSVPAKLQIFIDPHSFVCQYVMKVKHVPTKSPEHCLQENQVLHTVNEARNPLVKSCREQAIAMLLREPGGETAIRSALAGMSGSSGAPAVKGREKFYTDYIDFIISRTMQKVSPDFVPLTTVPKSDLDGIDVRSIAFYLPQFHAFPLNDEWYGKGFTEWTNTAKAIPQYTGHYQPHLPIDVGYYDLGDVSVMHRQVELARNYGIHGFCFHYYWFSGTRLMEKPLFQWLEHPELELPFCINWANENWGKLWDGGDQEVRHRQELLPGDDAKFFADILPFFKDSRYITVGGKPLFIVYRPHLFPRERFRQFAQVMRQKAAEHGFPGLYMVTANSHGFREDPTLWGLDAMLEFPPHMMPERGMQAKKLDCFVNPNFRGAVLDGADYVKQKKFLYETAYKLFKGVFPSWDNTPRKAYSNSWVIDGITPDVYREWLSGCIDYTRAHHSDDERLVFINAWNEWAEGAHLEPDSRFGYAYLQATRDALLKPKN